MPKQSKNTERIEIEFPVAIAAKLREQTGPGKVQSFVVGAVAKRLKLPYTAPTRGRPRKDQVK